MIGVELARELKEAGLEWKPKQGDWAYIVDPYDKNGTLSRVIGKNDVRDFGGTKHPEDVWLPSLSQLLAEIEGRGYEWETGLIMTIGGPEMPGRHKSGYWCEIWLSEDMRTKYRIKADTPEEAAGQALLWILRGGQDA